MTTNTRSIVIWVSALALLAAGITWVFWPSSAKLDPNSSTSIFTEISDSDWVTGNRESTVVLIEYSDFQCPACAFYHPIVQSILKEFGDRIQFVYRHFPLSIHANAKRAAFVAEAAGKQGKFWEMQALLFERQGDWKESNDIQIFESYASSLSLDIEKFRSDFSSDAVEEKVDRDSESALALDVNSTPTFFLNGQKIKSPLGYDQLRSLIQNALDGTL